MELFDPFKEGLEFVMRWFHIISGITWIGLLYFFNFVQVPAYAQLSGEARNEAIEEVTQRALWWFRMGAMATVGTGLIIIGIESSNDFNRYEFKSPTGASIYTGALFGIIMFLNVWLVIWPNQKVVIANASSVRAGGAPNPDAPTHARAAAMASRTNAFLSFPMLWFMAFTSHFAFHFGEVSGGTAALYWIVILAFAAFVELIALGIIGGRQVGGPLHWHIEQHKNTIIAGLVATAVIYLVLWEGVIGGS